MDPDIVDLNDGLFEVLLIQAPDTIPDLTMIVSELLNQQYDSEYLYFAKTKKALIQMDGAVRWTLDGEMQKGAGEIVIESVHDAYRLIVAQKEEAVKNKSSFTGTIRRKSFFMLIFSS